VQSMVAYLDLSPTAARVAVVQYSGPRKYYPPGDPKYEDYGKVETGLTSDRDTLNDAISGMRYVEEGPLGTYTGAALRMANMMLDSGRHDAAKAVLVLFDGGAHDFRVVQEQAQILKDRGVRLMFAVVSYPGAHMWEVMSAAWSYQSIASQPSHENVFQDGTYEQFTKQVANYAAAACKGAATPSPTPAPTLAGTPPPTPHRCDDGSHGCDKSEGGICYQVEGGVRGEGWLCDCAVGYECIDGCSAPHVGHTCKATPAPTPAPTAAPTAAPTPPPSVAPTPSPTTAPTAAPTAPPTEPYTPRKTFQLIDPHSNKCLGGFIGGFTIEEYDAYTEHCGEYFVDAEFGKGPADAPSAILAHDDHPDHCVFFEDAGVYASMPCMEASSHPSSFPRGEFAELPSLGYVFCFCPHEYCCLQAVPQSDVPEPQEW